MYETRKGRCRSLTRKKDLPLLRTGPGAYCCLQLQLLQPRQIHALAENVLSFLLCRTPLVLEQDATDRSRAVLGLVDEPHKNTLGLRLYLR